jgi:hypothetical protein
MRILLDEDTPLPLLAVLRHLLPTSQVDHVKQLGWSGKSDAQIYRDARTRGYDVVITQDKRQLDDHEHSRAIKRSGLHRIAFSQGGPGLRGLAIAMASVLASIVDVVAELEQADGQRLVHIHGIDPTRKRHRITDPSREPPKYWPR